MAIEKTHNLQSEQPGSGFVQTGAAEIHILHNVGHDIVVNCHFYQMINVYKIALPNLLR